ncbi:uroporphyrinogen-III C-methyltransferase [Sansalvadorimonas sp. 2012CJ34-2]|uniref:Uroporphyrinogen-III C-methyltransferase n=1 Tax=Parendozoicomonas callyspongiae TaxID=2942213 RepID=A0ABT0PBH2_9GAMM|nr:uroporphyrinogen-III C-methyltransferase [Sansalvadorimonas sp. 2012CJ34-2]
MNDKTSDQTPSTEVVNPEQNTGTTERKQEPKPRSVKSKSGNKTAVLALFLSLVTLAGLGAAGWFGYQTLWPQIAKQNWVNSQLESNKSAVTVGINQASRELAARTNEVSQQSQRLVTRMDNLDVRFNRLQGADRNDWKLAEAEYLMRLANQRLLTMHDLKSAHTLLAQADELLVAVDEYGLFNVRAALAEDIADIKATASVDIDKTWLQLNALSGRIEQLPVLAYQGSKEPVVSEEPATAPAQPLSWQDKAILAAKQMWNSFAGQFRIRETGQKSVTELLSPEQEMYLRQNLRLMFEQAQVALLQGRADIYRASLLNARDWLSKWFLNEGQEMQSMQESLSELANFQVEQRIPDISRSLVALKAYIDEKASQRLPVEPVDKEEEGTSSSEAKS